MKKLLFFFVLALATLVCSIGVKAQCSLAKFTTSNGSIGGADLATYDIHAGDVNKDGFQDIIFQGASGPFVYLNTTGKPGKVVTFTTTPDWSYTHKTSESFHSNNVADFNNDTLADIAEFYGNYLYIFRNTTSGKKITYSLDTSIYVTSMSSIASAGGDYGSTIVADINNDGYTDVICDTRMGTAYVFLNTTSSTGGRLSFAKATSITYSKKPPTTSYMYMEIANCGDLNNDGQPEFVVQIYDSLVVYKNTSVGSTLSFSRDFAAKFPKKPSLSTASGNFVFNMEIADIDRDGYQDVMTHFTVTNKSIDSNFVFFFHQKASKTKMSWDKITKMYLKWKPASGGTVDIGNCYLYSPACQKPNLIALFDAAESSSTNTFYFYENLSKPGNILFNPKYCIVNNAHSDAMAYADFNNDGIRDYVTYQDASAITIFTDTSHVHPVAKPTNKADITMRDTCIITKTGAHKFTYVSVGLLYLECATDTVGYKWTKGVSSNYAALLDSGTYSVRYTNTTGSVDSTITFHVTSTRLKPRISPIDTLTCPEKYISLKVRGAKSYSWTTDNSAISFGHPHDSSQFISAPPSSAHFRVIAYGNGGCVDTLKSTLVVGPAPHTIATPADTTICVGNSVNINVRGGGKYKVYPTAFLTTTDDSDYIAKPLSNQKYIFVGTMSNCTDTAYSIVNVHRPRYVSISTHHSPDTLFCTNEKPYFYLHNNRYNWAAGANIYQVNDSIFYCLPATAGVYTFYSTNDSICYDTTRVTITLENPPVITGLRDTFVCGGKSITLKASGTNTYQWIPNEFLNNDTTGTVVCTPLNDVTYKVIGSDIRCRDTAYVKVHYVPMPHVEAGPDSMIDYNTTFTFAYALTDGKYYQWKPMPTLTDTLTLEATTDNLKKQTNFVLVSWNEPACPVSDTITILIRTKPYVFFPTAFTPNGDGNNDKYRPLLHTVSRIDWRVYNRWGELMFEGNIKDRWDGTLNGQPAPQGTYIFTANATASYSGETLDFRGDFELIR